MTTIVLYSVHPMLAAGLGKILAETEDFRLAAACGNLAQIVPEIRRTDATLALIELTHEVTLPVLKEILREIHGLPAILWVDQVSAEFASQVIGVGIRGILRKTLSVDLHLECLGKVAQGELGLEKFLSDELLSSQRVALTPRERQMMGLVAQGLRNKEIAYSLGITEGTVKVYLSRLFQKVGATDRLDLALFALRNLAATGTFDAPVRRPSGSMAEPLFVTGFVSRPVERRIQ